MDTIMVSVETKSGKCLVPELEAHLGYWLRRVSNRVSGDFAQLLQERHVSIAEWVVMRHLYAVREASPGDLASALGLTRSAISKVMDKLEKKGWLASRPKPDDQRAQILSLTPQGKRALPELASIADRNDAAFFHCLSRAEQATLRRILAKLTDIHAIRNIPVE